VNYGVKFLVATMMLDPRIIDELEKRGVTDPSDKDILEATEKIYGETIDIDEAFKRVPPHLQALIGGLIVIAKRSLKKEWIEKITYENILELAEKRGLENVAEFLKSYPIMSRRIIDWLRKRVSG
jgi:hypothetical protein